MFNIGPMELLLILVLALIVFGPKRLPEIGRTVGRGLNEFRRASRDIQGEIEGAFDDEPLRPAATKRSTEPKPSSPPHGDGEHAISEKGRRPEPPGDGIPG